MKTFIYKRKKEEERQLMNVKVLKPSDQFQVPS